MDLLLSGLLAALVMRAYEHSKRRSRAAWSEARAQAAAHRAERERARKARARRRGKRLRDAKSDGPSDPLWWPYAAGWLAVAASRATYAAAQGAREGKREAVAEARERAKERSRARAEDRQKCRQDRARCAECGFLEREHRAGRCPGGDHDSVFARDGETAVEACTLCGVFVAAAELDTDGRCRVCAEPRRDGDEEMYFGGDPSDPNAVGDCLTCTGRAVVGDPPEPCPSCRARQQARNADHHERRGWETGAMRWSPDDGPETPGDPAGDDESNHPEGSTSVSTDLVAANGSGYGTGEGYTDTISTLNTLARQLATAHETCQNLADNLTANEVDAQTIGNVSELMDQLDAAAPLASRTAAHVQTRHGPLAEAVAGAGGSQNVARKDWYGDY